MLQLKNSTPFAAEMAIFPNEQGIDTLYTLVKASFVYNGDWMLAEEQVPPQMEDEYWGEPGTSSIKYGSDIHTGKPATDIIMLGAACAPNQQKVTQLDVELQVGQVSKTVRVFGDRQWMNGAISAPKPFSSMPITYERAFGGRHNIDEQSYLAEERNPVGCSFFGKRSSRDMEGSPLPNIEDPQQLIQYPKDDQIPAGFGYCAPNWLPRRQFAGTYDEAWTKQRAPYLPLDFNPRFLNAAHPDLIYPGYLQGGETVSIRNMHPSGDIHATLPQIGLKCEVQVAGQPHNQEMNIESLILEPNKKLFSMVWRAGFPCDKKALKINEVSVKLLR